MDPKSSIAIIDSGVGGLTVCKEVMRQLPRESIYYFGDNLRCPYGSREKDEICKFTLQILQFLKDLDIKALLIACNTISSIISLDHLQQELKMPVLGVIDPGARAAIEMSHTYNIGVLGTETTIKSNAYKMALEKIHPSVSVFQLACPDFVPLVESGERNTQIADRVVKNSLDKLPNAQIDTVILGCTHYPLLSHKIKKFIGKKINLISSASETARELSTILQHNKLLSDSQKTPKYKFYTTGSKKMFSKISYEWLDRKVEVDFVENLDDKEVLSCGYDFLQNSEY